MFNTSKIQFKSNSQPELKGETEAQCCVQYLKDTIQKQFTTRATKETGSLVLCSIPQRYNSKAIHNHLPYALLVGHVVFNTSKIQFKSNSQLISQSINVLLVVFNTSKIQFKSNSQHLGKLLKGTDRCVQYLKDTIQKQFTTTTLITANCIKLCSIPQRYNSKAIHNALAFVAMC